tara:strand:+ start:587 stop:718 length:132 start_codon:yes stop_codon:yes gene_type:complete
MTHIVARIARRMRRRLRPSSRVIIIIIIIIERGKMHGGWRPKT